MTTATPARMDVLLRPAALARAWMGAGRPQETIAVPGVVLEPGEALVRVELVTVGDDDLAVADGDRDCPVPTVLGREFVGRIAALGGRVRAHDGTPLELGERVVCAAHPLERIAAHRELVGGFATHVHLAAGTAIARVGEALPACILAPLPGAVSRAAAARRAIERAGDIEDLTVRITGTGLDPLVLSAMVVERGGSPLISSSDPRVRSRAHRFGAALAPPPPAPGDGALRVAVRRGTGTEAPVPIAGAHPSGDDLDEAVSFIRSPGTRRYPFADLVAAPLPLDRLDEAIELARRGTHLRTAIAPGA